jgi:uncharacterized membrane protein
VVRDGAGAAVQVGGEAAAGVASPAAAEVLAGAAREVTGNMKPKEFLEALDDDTIVRAISDAEKQTSSEIRLFVTENEVKDIVAEAQRQFVQMGMTKTELRNGVLIYFAPKARAFAVVGDEGIHKKRGQPLWDSVVARMRPLLKEGQYTKAIVAGIEEIGTVLSKEFPRKSDDRDELPNTIERDEPKK